MKILKMSLILWIIGLALSACDNFVEVDLPESQLTGNTVFENSATAEAALADIYSKLRDSGMLSGSGTGTGAVFGLYTDELAYYGLDGDALDNVYNNALLASNPMAAEYWNTAYNQVYSANAVIEGVENSVLLSQSDKDRFTGEAKFIRALVHFYLGAVFGEVPYIRTTSYQQNRVAQRTTAQEAYQLLVEDLTAATVLLPALYSNTERTIPNKATAYALLSRVYLYNSHWAEASDAASAVLNDPAYTWEEDLDNVFLKDATTTIWQFKPKIDGTNTDEAGVYIFVTGPPPSVSMSADFVMSFELGDLRQQHWIQAVSDGSTTWYHPYKYRENTTTGTSVEYSIVFRLAEQYLIRAEARTNQGDLIGAKEDVNRIRNTAGLENTPAQTAAEILSAIHKERRSELFTEYGHRFFDLKRSGTINEVLSASKPGWDAHDALWPLPETELLANPNLAPQNPGY